MILKKFVSWLQSLFLPIASGHNGPIYDVVYHPHQSDMFVSCSQDGRVLLWDVRKPKPAKLIGMIMLIIF